MKSSINAETMMARKLEEMMNGCSGGCFAVALGCMLGGIVLILVTGALLYYNRQAISQCCASFWGERNAMDYRRQINNAPVATNVVAISNTKSEV